MACMQDSASTVGLLHVGNRAVRVGSRFEYVSVSVSDTADVSVSDTSKLQNLQNSRSARSNTHVSTALFREPPGSSLVTCLSILHSRCLLPVTLIPVEDAFAEHAAFSRSQLACLSVVAPALGLAFGPPRWVHIVD